jgi:hypothetical protein
VTVALALPCAGPGDAGANEPQTTPDAGEQSHVDRVLVAVAGSEQETEAIGDALRELLARLGLQLRTTRADAPPWAADAAEPVDASGERTRARVWIDARPRDRVDVTVSTVRDGSFDPAVARTVARVDATQAIVVERVAHVVHATLETLLAPPEQNKSPQPAQIPPPGAEQPVAAAAQGSPIRNAGLGLDAAAFATCSAVASSSGALFGGGVSLDGLLRGAVLHPSLWLSAAIFESFDTQGAALTLETNVMSFRAVPTVQLLQLPAFELDLGAGVGVDLFHTIPRDAAPRVTLGEPQTLGDPIVDGLLLSRIRVARGARLLVGLGVDYDFGEHRYISADGPNIKSEVLQPWPVRPSAMLGLCIPLVGTSECTSAE